MQAALKKLSIAFLALLPYTPVLASQQCQGINAVNPNGGDVCSTTTLPTQLNAIIDAFFIIAGSVAVLIIVLAGIRYITSTGDATRIKASKDTILYAVVGLIVVILGRAIVGFVIAKIG